MTALREAISEKDAESQKHLSILDLKLQELETLKKNIGNAGKYCNAMGGLRLGRSRQRVAEYGRSLRQFSLLLE